MKLFSYFVSSASYRARIALNLKGIAYEYVAIDANSAEHLAPEFLAVNPQGLIPALVDGDHVLTQSLAIIEYLEETHPEPPFLPADPVERARVRALALVPNCEMHPVNNRRIREYIVNDLDLGRDTMIKWMGNWNAKGFATLEATLSDSPHTGVFCHGDRPTLADIYLIPQLDIARRFESDVSSYPTVLRIEEACLALPEFDAARPENQPDAPLS